MNQILLSMAGRLLYTASQVTPEVEPTKAPENIVNELASLDTSKFKEMWENFWPPFLSNSVSFLISVAIALIVFWIGKKLIRAILKIVNHAFERAKLDLGVSKFLCSVFNIGLYILLLTAICGIVGIETTSFAALIASFGLTIGLALQGSLSNFAGGVLILILHPFRIGDFIIANGNEGTVTAIDIFYTKILTIDNKMVVLPNGSLANSNITNVTNEPVRRLDLTIPIGYSDDIRCVKEELHKLSLRSERVIQNRPIDLFVSNFGDDAVEILLRVWVNTDEYLIAKSELLETIKYMFDEKGFTIPFHQMDITVVSAPQ